MAIEVLVNYWTKIPLALSCFSIIDPSSTGTTPNRQLWESLYVTKLWQGKLDIPFKYLTPNYHIFVFIVIIDFIGGRKRLLNAKKYYQIPSLATLVFSYFLFQLNSNELYKLYTTLMKNEHGK